MEKWGEALGVGSEHVVCGVCSGSPRRFRFVLRAAWSRSVINPRKVYALSPECALGSPHLVYLVSQTRRVD